MRFLLDEMISPRTAAALVARGIDAAHVREHGLAAADDELILEFACVDDWILVTANLRDFRPLHAQRVARGAPVRPLLLVTQGLLGALGASQAERAADLIETWAQSNPRPYEGEHWLDGVARRSARARDVDSEDSVSRER